MTEKPACWGHEYKRIADLEAQLAAAVAAEREACARVAENYDDPCGEYSNPSGDGIAAAIRNRKGD